MLTIPDSGMASAASSSRLPTKSGLIGSGSDTESRKRLAQLSKLLGTVLGGGSADNSDSSPGSISPAEQSPPLVDQFGHISLRSPSPSPSADFSFILSLTEEEVAQASEMFDYRPTTPEDVPTCTPRPRILRASGRRLLPRIWNAISSPQRDSIKSKRKQRGRLPANFDPNSPLDGEEGELVDDEACFVGAYSSSGIDIISYLPVEVACYILLHLDLASIVHCLSVSRYWNRLANDNIIWRDMFYRHPGWKVNHSLAASQARHVPPSGLVVDLAAAGFAGRDRTRSTASTNTTGSALPSLILTGNQSSHSVQSTIYAPLSLDWLTLFRTRLELHRRWMSGQPKKTTVKAHTDSVYCLEFDSRKIVTGSRDRTIKIWSLRTGKLKATYRGHHGSVLCLKFDQTGFMVSGSSDQKLIVWDLIKGEIVSTLSGHSGGVLDIRIDKEWIVSCSKDATVCVWDRATLSLHCALHGHHGPVNAVGLQNGKVISASGDGNMILWDIATQKRLKTFEGHDRGLACIEWKGDVIVSGSNDCNIKVWSVSTGECLMTLSGHDSLVRALSYNPSSGLLVSASYDKSIKIWDLTKSKLVRDFRDVHQSHIFDVKFDCARIISAGHDETVNIMDFGHDLDITLFS